MNAKYAKMLGLNKDTKHMENFSEGRWPFKEPTTTNIGLKLKELLEKKEKHFKGQERTLGSR